jgi:hypothetical protein
LPSRIQKREKLNASPRRGTKQEGFILLLPCSKDSKKGENEMAPPSRQTKTRRILYRPYPALKDSKREETKPLFTISLCTKKTRQGAEIRRIFLQFSLPCKRDRGDETATDLRYQKQKGRNGLRKTPIQPLL